MEHADYISEGYAHGMNECDDMTRRDILTMMSTPTISDAVTVLKKRYNKVKNTKSGSFVECPVCLKKFKKIGHNTFCSNGRTGKGNCKDSYWNTVDETRRHRAIQHNELPFWKMMFPKKPIQKEINESEIKITDDEMKKINSCYNCLYREYCDDEIQRTES